MPTNVYMTNSTAVTLGLTLAFGGPNTTFTGKFNLLSATIPSKAVRTKVLSVDRDGGSSDQTTFAELRLMNGTTYLASAQLVLTSGFDPLQLKNVMFWGWRTADQATGHFSNDYDPHSHPVTVGGQEYLLTLQGVYTGWLDDLNITVKYVPYDKIIVSNRSALIAKYQAAGFAQVDTALARLVGVDQKAGLKSTVIYLDDAAAMKAIGAQPVVNSADQQQVKVAIDGVFSALSPLQLTIFGAPDVVPHQALINPVTDSNPNVPSDLPYAASAPYSTKISDFLAPDRIIARLPDLMRGNLVNYPLSVLTNASNRTPGTVAQYKNYWSVTCDVWTASTTTSVTNIFGNAAAMAVSPPSGPAWTAAQMKSLSFFVNTHGGENDPEFSGQTGNQYPVCLTSALVAGVTSPNMIFSAECCFGAQLYDPRLAGGVMGIVNQVMLNGCAGYFGSSNTAYGPAAGQGQADIVTQDFLIGVLVGKTPGQAALDARQTFIRTQNMTLPVNLKTLGQFMLIGDTGFAPVVRTPIAEGEILEPSGAMMTAENERRANELRSTTDHSEPAPDHAVPAVVTEAISRLVEERGFSNFIVTPHRVILSPSSAGRYAGQDVHVYEIVEQFEQPGLRSPGFVWIGITASETEILDIQETASK